MLEAAGQASQAAVETLRAAPEEGQAANLDAEELRPAVIALDEEQQREGNFGRHLHHGADHFVWERTNNESVAQLAKTPRAWRVSLKQRGC